MHLIDKNKTIIMTKMAIYDKNNGDRDKKINEYFRHDYIYRKNAWTRICVTLGCVFVLVGYWTHKIIDEGLDVFNMDYKRAGMDMLLFLFLVLAFYTFVGTIRAAIDYSESQKRLRRYSQMINRLERIRPQEEHSEEASDLYYGADFVNKRNHH